MWLARKHLIAILRGVKNPYTVITPCPAVR
jgi:hypothetical protein